MKYLSNRLIGFAILGATVMACTDEYDWQSSGRKA